MTETENQSEITANKEGTILTNQDRPDQSAATAIRPVYRTKLRLNKQKALSLAHYKNFPQNWFIELTALKDLSLNYCALNNLESTVFEHLIHLENLDLSYNSVKNLNSKIFITNSKLRHLNLAQNKIEKLDTEIFIGLVNLKTLDLSNNCIAEIPNQLFRDLVNLMSLHLYRNKINFNGGNSIKIFDDLKKLKLLDLSTNCITDIPNGLFQDLVSLRDLYLHKNKINFRCQDSNQERTNVFKSLNNVEVLDLSRNCITEIPSGLFQNLIGLRELNLSRNKIEKLDI